MIALTRRRKVWLAVLGGLVVLVGAGLWALPVLVRRVAVSQLTELTKRPVSLEDVDLNLFTGRVVLKHFRLGQREGPGSALELERLDLRLALWALAKRDVLLRELVLTAPTIHATRTRPAEFDFSDLLALIPPSDPSRPPSKWTVTVDRIGLVRGTVVARDQAVSPASEWKVEDLTVEGGGITTRAGATPGALTLRLRLNGTPVELSASSLRLTPTRVAAHASIDGFDLAWARPYLPADVPATPTAGKVGLALDATLEREATVLKTAVASGEIRLDGLEVVRSGQTKPFTTLGSLRLTIKGADLVARAVTVGSVEVHGLEVRAARDRTGQIDLLQLRRPSNPEGAAVSGPAAPAPASSSGPPASPSSPELAPSTGAGPARPFVVRIEHATVDGSGVTFDDAGVSPARTWRLAGLTLDARGLSTSSEDPAGTLGMKAQLGRTAISAQGTALRLTPPAGSVQATIGPFDLTQIDAYLPPRPAVTLTSGTLDLAAHVDFAQGPNGLRRGMVSADVRLGRLAVARRNEPRAPFASLARGRVKVKEADLVAWAVTVESVEVQGLDVRAVRDAQGTIDLLALVSAPAPAGTSTAPGGKARGSRPEPPARTPAEGPGMPVRVEHVAVTKSAVSLADRAVNPPREWRLDDLTVDARKLSTAPRDPPARLTARARLGEARLTVRSPGLRLVPPSGTVEASVSKFDLTRLGPYLPPKPAVALASGMADLSLRLDFARGESGLRRGLVAGDAKVNGLAVAHRDTAHSIASIGTVAVALTRADLLSRDVEVASVEVTGLDARVVRDQGGRFDLLTLATGGATPADPPSATAAKRPAAASGPSPAGSGHTGGSSPSSGSPAAGPGFKLTLDRFALTKSKVTLTDQTTHPTTTLGVTDLDVQLRHVTWPSAGPAALTTTLTVPGGGRLEIKGDVTPQPLEASFAMSIRNAPIEPYQGYFPFKAQFAGRFNGDSQSHFKVDGGVISATSRGRSFIERFEVRDPGDPATPPVRIARIDLAGIDFAWPGQGKGHARVAKVTVTKPDLRVERRQDGTINLRDIFLPAAGSGGVAGSASAGSPGSGAGKASGLAAKGSTPAPKASGPAAKAPASKPPAAKTPAGKGAAPGGATARAEPPLHDLPLALEIGDFVIEDGFARFLDRSTKPAFSESLSRLAVRVTGLGTEPADRRAKVLVQSVVGGDSALDIRGEVAPFARDLYLDLTAELRDFALTSANPYANSLIAWIVQRGKLGAKLHYRIENGTLTASNEVVVGHLDVARSEHPSDEVKQRIGLPLGLIVALIKDSRGDIHVTVPVTGSVSDPAFDWSETIWRAVKNVIVNIVAAPFRAIGRLFKGKDETIEGLAIRPVTFGPGSADVPQAMEQALVGIADFLRRSPYVKLDLLPVATARDVESLRAQELTARLQRLQRERNLPDFKAAVALAFAARFKGEKPPDTPEKQLARLLEQEPEPPGRLEELLRRRVEAVREALTKSEGIPADRLRTETGSAAPAPEGEGRVEFKIGS